MDIDTNLKIDDSYKGVITDELLKDPFYYQVIQGIRGDNIGLTMGLPKVEQTLCGIQKGTITLLGGGTGSGKTTYALYAYIYAPLREHLETGRYKILYFSLEMTTVMLEAKLMSLYIYETYGIVISYNEILSRLTVLDPDKFKLLVLAKSWLDKVRKCLIVYDGSFSAMTIRDNLTKYAKRNGVFKEEGDNKITYIPKNPNETVMIIVDHLGLVQGPDKKRSADDTSSVLMDFRKICKYSALELMQINRGASSMDRRTNNMQEIEIGDFKGTGNPSEDADAVIALFSPSREKMKTYHKYPVNILQDRIRSLIVLKSRFGVPEQATVLGFYGEVGLFKELPSADTFPDPNQWIKYKNLDFKEDVDNSNDQLKEEKTFLFTM